jgi:hypothetical protein
MAAISVVHGITRALGKKEMAAVAKRHARNNRLGWSGPRATIHTTIENRIQTTIQLKNQIKNETKIQTMI